MITKFIEAHEVNRSRWDRFLPQALFACRIQASRTTGNSPFQLTYGLSPKLPPNSSPPIIGKIGGMEDHHSKKDASEYTRSEEKADIHFFTVLSNTYPTDCKLHLVSFPR